MRAPSSSVRTSRGSSIGFNCRLFIADIGGIFLLSKCFLHVKQRNSMLLPLNGDPWIIVILPGGSMHCWSMPSFLELMVCLSSFDNSVTFVLKQRWWQHVQMKIALKSVASRNFSNLSLAVLGFDNF